MGEFFSTIFPAGFWTGVATLGMVVFLIFGVDLLLGARLMAGVSRVVDRKFQVDQMLLNALQELKKRSDKDFVDVDNSILRGWGRFVMSGLLFFGALLILLVVLPATR